MCRIDYADDSEGQWLTEPHEVTSRKPHKCEDCGREIAKGERYYSGAWVGEFGLTPLSMCSQCVVAGRWLKKVCGGHFWPGVIEELQEHLDEEPDLYSRPLDLLVKLGKDHRQFHGQLVPVERVERLTKKAVALVPASAHA